MATGFPDWLRAMALMGKHDDDYIVMAVDEDGQFYAITKGEDGAGVLRPLRVDASGQLIMVPRGESGNYMAVDAAGNLTMVAKGEDAGEDLRNLRVDASGQLIMVPRGESGNYLEVDGDGYMTTVIKGDDEGTLRTVTLDTEGRLSAFVVDSSDVWGEIVTMGNAELAARLNSPVIYDRRGKVYFIDSFEFGLSLWETDVDGTGAAVALTPTPTVYGGYSVKLTGGSDAGQYALIRWRRGTLPGGKIGMGSSFCIPASVDNFHIALRVYDGTNRYLGALRYEDGADNLEYLSSANVWTVLAAAVLPPRDVNVFSLWKLVIDAPNSLYTRALFNDQEIDMSALALRVTADVVDPHVWCEFRCSSRAANNDVVYVDSVVLTASEP